jgi:hypothetical protein
MSKIDCVLMFGRRTFVPERSTQSVSCLYPISGNRGEGHVRGGFALGRRAVRLQQLPNDRMFRDNPANAEYAHLASKVQSISNASIPRPVKNVVNTTKSSSASYSPDATRKADNTMLRNIANNSKISKKTKDILTRALKAKKFAEDLGIFDHNAFANTVDENEIIPGSKMVNKVRKKYGVPAKTGDRRRKRKRKYQQTRRKRKRQRISGRGPKADPFGDTVGTVAATVSKPVTDAAVRVFFAFLPKSIRQGIETLFPGAEAGLQQLAPAAVRALTKSVLPKITGSVGRFFSKWKRRKSRKKSKK